MKKILLALLIVWSIPLNINATAPTLTSASATDTVRGATLNLGGSGFETKSPAKPRIYADLENGIQPTTWGSSTTWDEVENLVWVTSDTMYGDSVGMAKGTLSTGISAFDFMHKRLGTWTTMYVHLDRYYGFDPGSATNLKDHRIWGPGTTGPPDFLTAIRPSNLAYNECNTSNPDRFTGTTPPGSTWLSQDAYFIMGPVTANPPVGDVGTGVWQAWVNGRLNQSVTTVGNCEANMTEYRTDNFIEGISNGSSVWMDNIYIDDTFLGVYITTSPTWAKNGKRVPCPAKTWSDGSITANLVLEAFSSTDTLYAYVMNSGREVNANGQQISLSGGGSPVTPTPTIKIGNSTLRGFRKI